MSYFKFSSNFLGGLYNNSCSFKLFLQQNNTAERHRDVVLHCHIVYLGEKEEDLCKSLSFFGGKKINSKLAMCKHMEHKSATAPLC